MHLTLLLTYLFIITQPLVSSLGANDLTRQDPITKIVKLSGRKGKNHYYEPSHLYLETGKLYKLILKNDSDSKHYFSSNSFAKSIFTRKVQLINNRQKVSEVKGIISEVEVWPNQEIEWWFVPIKTGIFDDLFCKVKDPITLMNHKDMGMIGKITIK